MSPLAAAAAAAGENDHSTLAAIEVVLVLLLAATGLAILARRVGIPYPILLVLGGLGLGLVPGLPRVELEPELVFLLFLPPILVSAGYFTSIRDLQANLRPIGLLAVGLVLFTMVIVAVVARAVIPDLSWPVALALGAIVAPPDAVAATAVFQRLGVPRRIVTILEGESLINDATALVAYRFAVAAGMGMAFSPLDAGLNFVFVAVGGVVLGLAVGWVVRVATRRLDDPVFSIVITFLAPGAAYLPAEQLGLSGVLATVAAGLYLGRHAARSISSNVRIAGAAAWQVLLFLINGAVFILIGLQLPLVLEGLTGRPAGELAVQATAVALAAIVARIVWVFPATYLPRRMSARLRARDPYPPARSVFLVSWAGMRGVVSLAAALALPAGFPQRDLLIFLTFAVILATLVGQGLSLPFVIERLGLRAEARGARDEAEARIYLAEAAVDRIGALETRWPEHRELVDALRVQYGHRAQHLGDDGQAEPTSEAERELLEHREIRLSVIDAEREALIRLRDAGGVSDDVFRRIERDLDLEELRMDA